MTSLAPSELLKHKTRKTSRRSLKDDGKKANPCTEDHQDVVLLEMMYDSHEEGALSVVKSSEDRRRYKTTKPTSQTVKIDNSDKIVKAASTKQTKKTNSDETGLRQREYREHRGHRRRKSTVNSLPEECSSKNGEGMKTDENVLCSSIVDPGDHTAGIAAISTEGSVDSDDDGNDVQLLGLEILERESKSQSTWFCTSDRTSKIVSMATTNKRLTKETKGNETLAFSASGNGKISKKVPQSKDFCKDMSNLSEKTGLQEHQRQFESKSNSTKDLFHSSSKEDKICPNIAVSADHDAGGKNLEYVEDNDNDDDKLLGLQIVKMDRVESHSKVRTSCKDNTKTKKSSRTKETKKTTVSDEIPEGSASSRNDMNAKKLGTSSRSKDNSDVLDKFDSQRRRRERRENKIVLSSSSEVVSSRSKKDNRKDNGPVKMHSVVVATTEPDGMLMTMSVDKDKQMLLGIPVVEMDYSESQSERSYYTAGSSSTFFKNKTSTRTKQLINDVKFYDLFRNDEEDNDDDDDDDFDHQILEIPMNSNHQKYMNIAFNSSSTKSEGSQNLIRFEHGNEGGESVVCSLQDTTSSSSTMDTSESSRMSCISASSQRIKQLPREIDFSDNTDNDEFYDDFWLEYDI